MPTIRSYKVYESRIRRELISRFGDKPIAEIRRRDVVTLIEQIAERSGKAAALGAMSVLRKLLNWALLRDIPGYDVNPATAVKPADLLGAKKSRDRLLSDTELAAILGCDRRGQCAV